ncbi:MAG: hypothetical protein KF764_28665 [Labilithrix sp.]|nr:hypothetical protein [Labilithrix sp.]
MRRDPKRLADVGANATPEDRLLASLIEHHRAARPTAAGLREIARRADALAPPGAGAARFHRFTRFGAAAAACAAIAVIGMRVASLSTAPSPAQPSASSADTASEPSELAPRAPNDPPASAHDAVPVDMLPSEPVLAEGRPQASPIAPPTQRAGVARSKRPCDEAELIDRAETLLRTGQPGSALEVTRVHAACDGTVLDQERERIAIEALVRLGRDQEATTRARAFEVSYPSSPHLRRVRQLVGLGAE